MPVMATLYGREIIDTLHERMRGDAQLLGPANEGAAPDGAWGRLLGHWGHRDGDAAGILGGGGPEFDYNFGALQAGLDLYRRKSSDGQRDNAGIYLAIGQGSADVEHTLLGRTFRGGEDEFNAVSVGGYWTHFGQNNWYLDGVVQGTRYDMQMTSRRGLRDGDTDGFGFAASLEGDIRSNLAAAGCSSHRRNSSTKPSTLTTSMTARRMCATPTPIRWPVGSAPEWRGTGTQAEKVRSASSLYGAAPTSGMNSSMTRQQSSRQPLALSRSPSTPATALGDAGHRGGHAGQRHREPLRQRQPRCQLRWRRRRLGGQSRAEIQWRRRHLSLVTPRPCTAREFGPRQANRKASDRAARLAGLEVCTWRKADLSIRPKRLVQSCRLSFLDEGLKFCCHPSRMIKMYSITKGGARGSARLRGRQGQTLSLGSAALRSCPVAKRQRDIS